MLNNKIVILPGLIVMVMVMTIGCYKTTTIVKNPGSEITKEMSFSKDIVPIFEKSCAANSGCHGAGAKTPNLTASAAYKALTDGSYIKAGDADNSVLILWLTGKKSPVMPLGAGPDQNINAQVYAWIAQGAKNN